MGNCWILFGHFSCIVFTWTRRFYTRNKAIIKYQDLKDGLVWIPLQGKIKGEDHVDICLLRLVPTTSSGIKILEWRERLVVMHNLHCRVQGPAICHNNGFLISSREMNNAFWLLLEDIWSDGNQRYFHSAITTKESICEKYTIGRSCRRSSESRPIAMKVLTGDRETGTCWSNEYKAKGKRPAHKLRVPYADQELLNSCFERYTYAM